MPNIFSIKKAGVVMNDSEADKPAALSAFLTPPSRLIENQQSTTKIFENDFPTAIIANNKSNKTNYTILTPEQISQKVASLLKPGPPFYSEVSSADLIENLSNASLMRCDGVKENDAKPGWLEGLKKSLSPNDSVATTEEQEQPWTGVGTVWSALDSLPSGTTAFNLPTGTNEDIAKINKQDDQDGLWSSIMLSCDLNGNNLHLTQSCVIPTSVLFENHFYQGNKKALFEQIGAGTKYKWDDWSKEEISPNSMSSYLSLYTMPTIESWQWPSWVPYLGQQKGDNSNDKQPTTTEPSKPSGSKRIWVPSTTQVSVHATWWGYTIYIPVSVFPELDSDVNQAEKIANLVYTVLQTILNHASSLPIPTALKAALTIMNAISPSLSYISTFIGWSWNEIKSFNQGQGVELSATWLLPIALIPHTWDAATAPADQNGDGTPDGPPIEPSPEPEQPVPTNPTTSPTPTEGGNDEGQKQPEQQVPTSGSEPVATEPASSTPTSPEVTPVPDQSQEPVPEEPQTTEPEPASEEPAQEEPAQEEPTTEQPAQEELTPEEPTEEAPTAAEEEQPLTEDAVKEESKSEEAEETTKEEIVESEPIVEESPKVEEQETEKELPEEPPVEEEIVQKREEELADVPEVESAEIEEQAQIETPGLEEEQGELSIASTEPTTPADVTESVSTDSDPLEAVKVSEEETVSTPPSSTPIPESVEQAPTKKVQDKSSAKVKKGARKLFGKVTNRA